MSARDHVHRHQFGRAVWGPRATSHDEAVRNGFTEGPFFHSTSRPEPILQHGFMAPPAEDWQVDDPEWHEVFNSRGGTTRPVFVGTSPEAVDGYGTHVLAVMARPGTLRERNGAQIAHPADVVPLTSVPLSEGSEQ